MTDIAELVQNSVANIATTGQLNEIIEKALTKTVEDIVESQLRSYSDFGRALRAKIEADLVVDLSNVNFTEYNKVVMSLVEGAVNNAVTASAEEKLRKDVAALFEAPPAQIKLSELIDKFKEEIRGDECGCPDNIGLIIERNYSEYECLTDTVYIGLNPSKKMNSYRDEYITKAIECDFGISIRLDSKDDDCEIGTLSYTSDRSSERHHSWMPTCLFGTSRLLYQMYCAGSKIEFDQGFDADDYDTGYGYGD